MEFTVSSGGAVCGTLAAEREGLYWHIRAHCRAMPGVVRLHGCAPDGTRQPLGVLLPEDGALCLHRKVSASALPLTEVATRMPVPGRTRQSAVKNFLNYIGKTVKITETV